MRALLVLIAGLVLTAGCAVPDLLLDGKQCPCTAVGWVCDPLTNRCLQTNDAGAIIDTPSATSCLPTSFATESYRYAGTFDWQREDGSWSGGAEIQQSSSNEWDSYAYKASPELANARDVHVISSMREIGSADGQQGLPALGIVLRAQLSPQDKSRYACMWSDRGDQLYIEVAQGDDETRIATVDVADMDYPNNFTMEAQVSGSMLACCIREIPGARIIGAMSSAVAQGYPGLQTSRMQAAFGSFVVFRP